MQEGAIYLPDHDASSDEIRVALIQKTGIALGPFKSARAIRMVWVVDEVAKIVRTVTIVVNALPCINQNAVVDVKAFRKVGQIGDEEFSSRKRALKLRMGCRLLGTTVR